MLHHRLANWADVWVLVGLRADDVSAQRAVVSWTRVAEAGVAHFEGAVIIQRNRSGC